MQDKIKDSDFDVRTMERHLAAGRLSPEEVQAYLDQLDDCGEEADWTTTQMAQPPLAEPEGSEA
jgi:hypothetical protein